MGWRRGLAVMTATTILLSGCVAQQTPAALEPVVVVTSPPPDERIGQSDALLATRVDPAMPGCSAAVGVHGTVVWAGALGMADLATATPLTPTTRFDIASLTKQFTATAVLLLQREGKLSLSDPVGTYVPGLPAWGNTITLDALMHHTSHIPDYWMKLGDWGYGFTTPAVQADAVRAIAAVSRLEKGTGYLYSNSNYILLAEVITRVSGQHYEHFVTERIFAPLRLNVQIDPILQAPDIAVGYDDNIQPTRNAWAFYGAFGTFTTPTELARWGDEYRSSSLVGNDFVIGAVDSGEAGEPTEGRFYGAGINIQPDGTLRHDGRLGGFISTIKISADLETTVVVMCNAHLADRFGVADGLWSIWVDAALSGD